MRKKILAVLFLVLTVVMTGCGTKKTNSDVPKKEEQRKNVKETDSETGEEYYLLADFENYYECSQVNYIATFGTVTEVGKEEKDMVPYGEQSVKMEILGTESSWRMRRPTMRISTNNGFFDATADFSDMSKLTFDIYNAQDYEASIRFYIDTDISQGHQMIWSIFVNSDYGYNIVNIIDLKPNSWNHIEIPAESIRIVNYDANGKPYFVYGEEALKEVGGFNIEFDRGEVHEEQEVFYFDNVRAYLKSE